MKSTLIDRFSSNGDLLAGGITPYPVHPDVVQVQVPALVERTAPVPPLPRDDDDKPVRFLVQTGRWSLGYLWVRCGAAAMCYPHQVRLITSEYVYVSRRDGYRRLRLDRHLLERDGRHRRVVDGQWWMFRHPGWPCRDKAVIHKDLPATVRADGLKFNR